VLDLLVDLNRARGTTIVMVLHDLNLASRYADEIVAVCRGRIHALGSPGDVVTAELVSEVFGLDSEVIPDPLTGKPLVLPRGRHHVN
jgi:iron complex transport system ATP-binding protein